MTDSDELYQRRQGFWLRMARERAGKSQAGAAELIGLSKNSKSSISDYENGVTPVPLRMLRLLARYYGVPLRTFTEPEATAEERLNEIARGATGLAFDDLAEEEGPSPDGAAPPNGRRGTQ